MGSLKLALGLVITSISLIAEMKQGYAHKLFILRKESTGQWCLYSNPDAWKKEADGDVARVVAVAKYQNRLLRRIEITRGDESGDWVLKDAYEFDASGEVTVLQRTIDVLPEDIRRSQRYVFVAGQLRSSTTQDTSSVTHEIVSKTDAWIPEFPVVKAVKKFPFFGLLLNASVLKPDHVECICERAGNL